MTQPSPNDTGVSRAALAEDVVNTIAQLQPKLAQFDRRDEYGVLVNGEGYSFDEANKDWTNSLNIAVETASRLRDLDEGFGKLPDGTIMPTSQMSPEQLAYVTTYNNQLWGKMAQDYGLSNYEMQSEYATGQYNREAERAIADFNNKIASTGQKMDLDQLTMDQADQQIDRHLRGLGESRSRADLIARTQLDAAPYATAGGKTSFSGQDLGGGVSSLARMAGINPAESLLNYTGVSQVDPEGTMNRLDQQFGVGGPLPQAASLLTTAMDVPSAPTLPELPNIAPPPTLSPPGGGATESLLAALMAQAQSGAGQAPAKAGLPPWEPSGNASQDALTRPGSNLPKATLTGLLPMLNRFAGQNLVLGGSR